MNRFRLRVVLGVFISAAGILAVTLYSRMSSPPADNGIRRDLEWVIITGPAGSSATDLDQIVRIASSTSEYVKIYASADAFLAAPHPQLVQLRSAIEIGPTVASLPKLTYPPQEILFFQPTEMPPDMAGRKLPWKMFVFLDHSLCTERPLVWKAWTEWCATYHAKLFVGKKADGVAEFRDLVTAW